MELSGQRVLITGGTRGIGLELTRALLARGATVAVCGRRKRALDAVDGNLGEVTQIVCDLTEASRLPSFVAEVRAAIGAPSMLVNNAGVQIHHLWPETAPDETLLRVEQEVRTNLTALLGLTALLLPDLRSHPQAAIVNVSSALALVPRRNAAVYSATKAALHSFTRTLRDQLGEGSKLRVVEVFPPLVDTEMTRGRGGRKMAPEKVAKKIVRGLEKDRDEIWIGAARILRIVHRLSPRLAARLVRER